MTKLVSALQRHRDMLIVFAVALGFFSALKLNQYMSFSTTFEPADYELVLWNTLHGHFLQMPCSTLSFLGEHFSPILLLILPIYLVAQSPVTLILLHAIGISAAVVPLYLLVREFTSLRWPPLAISLAYFLSRTVNYGLMYDIHPEVLYPFLFFAMFLSIKKQNWRSYYAFLLLSFMIKEDVFVATFGLGLFLVSMGQWKHGLTTSIMSILCLLVVVRFIIPIFQGQAQGSDYRFIAYWSGYGTTQKEVLLNFLNPMKHLDVIFTAGKLKQMFNLFSVFVFLPFVSWRAFVFLVLPNWFMLYSSSNSLMNGPIIYYGMLITPSLFFSSLLGIQSLANKWPKRSVRLFVVLSSLVFLVQLGNSRIFNQIFKDPWQIPTRYTATANQMLDLIPPKVAVSAQVNLISHVPKHPCRSTFPSNLKSVTYIFLDYQGNPWPLTKESYRQLVDSLRNSSNWKIVEERDELLLLRSTIANHSGE